MSDAHQAAHTSPVTNPKRILLASLAAFLALILIMAGFVWFELSNSSPSGAVKSSGLSQAERDLDIAERLRKVGSVEIHEAEVDRPLASGEDVFKGQCFACHGTPGIPAAPHLNDAAAWGPRIGQGYDTLLGHALKGFNAMPAQGGGRFKDIEVGRAVVYMANAGGAKFAEPEPPADAK
jgi:cytochrome c5